MTLGIDEEGKLQEVSNELSEMCREARWRPFWVSSDMGTHMSQSCVRGRRMGPATRKTRHVPDMK